MFISYKFFELYFTNWFVVFHKPKHCMEKNENIMYIDHASIEVHANGIEPAGY